MLFWIYICVLVQRKYNGSTTEDDFLFSSIVDSMAEANCQLSFTDQMKIARNQINTNFERLLQNVIVLKTRLLKELDALEEENRRQMQNEDELRRLTQQLSLSFSSSLSLITRRIEQLVIEKRDSLLLLDWDMGTEQVLLNHFCKISVKKQATGSSEQPLSLPSVLSSPEVYTHPPCYDSDSDESEPEVEETHDDCASSSSSSDEDLTLERKYKRLDTPESASGSKGGGYGDLDDPRRVGIDDSTDDVYVADCNNNCIVLFDRDGSYVREFTHKRMVSPNGLCVSGSLDRVYITIDGRNAVHCYKRDGTFLKEILDYSQSCISFDTPSGVAIGTAADGSERVYVCDRGNNRVPVFSKFLGYMTTLATQLDAPRDVQVMGNEVAILHGGTYLVSFYTRGGMFLRRVIKQGFNKQKVGSPFFFCIDSDGNILVTDTHHDCVKVYRRTGFHICNIGSIGDSPGEFREPSGIALFDDDSIVTLCDRDDDQLQIFSL